MGVVQQSATADVRKMLGDAKLPAWFGADRTVAASGWRINQEHQAESKQTYISWHEMAEHSRQQSSAVLERRRRIVTGLQTRARDLVPLFRTLWLPHCDEKDLQIQAVLYCSGKDCRALRLTEGREGTTDRSACDVQVRTFNMGHESCERELAVCANWLAKVLAVDSDTTRWGAAAGRLSSESADLGRCCDKYRSSDSGSGFTSRASWSLPGS